MHCQPLSLSSYFRVAVVPIQSDSALRLDHCESCRGYLETYVRHGYEAVLLADWTSLHLDVLACQRGLARKAFSLYDLGALLLPATR